MSIVARAQAEEVFRTTRSAARPGPQGPTFAGALTTAPVRDRFDPATGLP
jgi:hypothetical protein